MSSVFKKTLIAPTTAEEMSKDSFTVFAKGQATITCGGLLNDETLTFYIEHFDNYIECRVNDTLIQLSRKTVMSDLFLSVGNYKVKKSVTANPVGVEIISNVPMEK